jgi:hypothetical protein
LCVERVLLLLLLLLLLLQAAAAAGCCCCCCCCRCWLTCCCCRWLQEYKAVCCKASDKVGPPLQRCAACHHARQLRISRT